MPPPIVPAWLPSAKTAIQAPTPRGDDPAVPATTTSSHVSPARRAASAAFTTSSFSIAAFYPLKISVSIASASSTPPPTDVALSEM